MILNYKQGIMTKKIEKSLQKFTDFSKIQTKDDVTLLDKDTKHQFFEYLVDELNNLLNNKKDVIKLDKVVELIKNLFPDFYNKNVKNVLWCSNHSKICLFIDNYIGENCIMPSSDQIANGVNLSRQTVTKHLKSFAGELYEAEMDKHRYMTSNVLAKLYKIGLSGNVGALKVYLDFISKFSMVKKQTNYIQINNTRIDEVTINGLPDDAKRKIEEIVKGVGLNKDKSD